MYYTFLWKLFLVQHLLDSSYLNSISKGDNLNGTNLHLNKSPKLTKRYLPMPKLTVTFILSILLDKKSSTPLIRMENLSLILPQEMENIMGNITAKAIMERINMVIIMETNITEPWDSGEWSCLLSCLLVWVAALLNAAWKGKIVLKNTEKWWNLEM